MNPKEIAAMRANPEFTADNIPPDLADFCARLDGIATPEAGHEAVRRYTTLIGAELPLFTCGCCGVRPSVPPREGPFPLVDLAVLDLLHLPPEAVADYEAMLPEYQPARAVYRSTATDSLFHLHADMVEVAMPTTTSRRASSSTDSPCECVRICHLCMSKLFATKPKIPEFSVVYCDYGNAARAGLPTLSLIERMIICRVRTFVVVIKLLPHLSGSQLALKGCSISFPCQGPEVCASKLPNLQDLFSYVCVVFVGPKHELEKRLTKALCITDLKARPAAVLAWLRFLKHNNKYYKDIEIDDSTEMVARINALTATLVGSAELMSSSRTAALEKVATSGLNGLDLGLGGRDADAAVGAGSDPPATTEQGV